MQRQEKSFLGAEIALGHQHSQHLGSQHISTATSLARPPALRIEQWRSWQVISPPLILKGGK